MTCTHGSSLSPFPRLDADGTKHYVCMACGVEVVDPDSRQIAKNCE